MRASASEARERTHQSSSEIASSRYLMLCVVPISFRISTAARRLYSFSDFSAAIRYFAVSGSFAATDHVDRLVHDLEVRIEQQARITAMSIAPFERTMPASADWRTSLFGSFSASCSALPTAANRSVRSR